MLRGCSWLYLHMPFGVVNGRHPESCLRSEEISQLESDLLLFLLLWTLVFPQHSHFALLFSIYRERRVVYWRQKKGWTLHVWIRSLVSKPLRLPIYWCTRTSKGRPCVLDSVSSCLLRSGVSTTTPQRLLRTEPAYPLSRYGRFITVPTSSDLFRPDRFPIGSQSVTVTNGSTFHD